MAALQAGVLGSFLLFVVLPGVALAAAIALSVYEVYRIGERKLLIVIVILALMFQHQLLEAYAFVQTGEAVSEGFGEIFETGANLVASGSVYYVLRFARRERNLLDDLEESERRFRLIAEHIDEIIYLATADFSEILYINPAYEQIYNRPVEELDENPRAFVEAAHPDDRERYIADVERLVADVEAGNPQDVYEGEYRLGRDGDTRHVTVSRFPVENDDGTVDRIVGRVQDITERKRREQERQQAERRFELVTRNLDEAIFIARGPRSPRPGDGDAPALARWEFEYLTPAVEHALDRPIQDVYDDPTALMELLVPDDRPAYDDWLDDISEEIASGTIRDSYSVEYRVRDSDGEIRWMRTNAYPAPLDEDADHGHCRLVGITEDITEQRQRQQRLEAERDRRSVLFENTPDPIMTVTFEDGQPHITEVNEAFENVFGFDAESLADRPLAETIIPDDERERFEDFRKRAARGEAIEAEASRLTVDGERDFLFQVIPFEEDGTRHAYVWYTDITDRKRRKRELRQLNQEYETIFENVQDALFLIDVEDADSDVEFVYRRLTGPRRDPAGPPSEQLEGQTPREAFGSEQGAEMATNYRQVIDTEQTLTYEEEIERPGGTSIWRTRLSPVVVDGEVTQIVGSARDITERKRRERMIETLHDATERLQTAETTEAVCQTAVRAAKDVLNLSMTACWLHRDTDDDPHLAPIAATDSVWEIDPSPFRPGDIEYEAYRDDETLVYDPSEYFPENPLDAAIMLPLGDHGMLAVGKQGVQEYDEFVVDAARTLAGHVRTALDRVARAEKLRENERRLEAILDRIDEAIYLAPASAIKDNEPATDYVSSGYEGVYGLSLEAMHETYDEGFFGVLHPDEYDDYRAFVEAICADIETGTPEDRYSREYRIEPPDGTVRWVHSDFYPTEWEDGDWKIVVASRDITDRKERERTLESFHDATEELTTVDTVAEAADIAVRAAGEVFDLPATAVYSYDEESGALEPAARGPSIDSDLPALTAEDGPAWTAFVEERMQRVAVEDIPALDIDAGDDPLLVPLGRNGLLVAWHTGAELDHDAATIMAATIEAALNRLRGEQQLATQSEELEAQVERASRLEAITELTQRVEAAITTESSRRGIQEAVCEELIDVEPFEAAWIAEADVGTDQLVPRAVSGIDRDDAEQTLVSDDPEIDPHPARRAWERGDPVVVDDLVGSRRDGWRRVLLKRGSGSVCAVPLAYSGITHGILTVVAEDPDAFGERELEVLDQLGTSIGYAITAIERQHALESDDTLELEFEGDDTDLPPARLARDLECRVRHERTIRRQDGSVSVYYTLEGDLPDDIATAAAETLPGVVETVARENGQATIERQGSSWFGVVVAEYGGIVRSGIATPRSVTLVVELPQEADTRTIVEQVRDAYPELELTAQRQHREATVTTPEVTTQLQEQLSDRQYEALETAHAMGYFDWPRESSGEEVAKALDITQPTVNKHLRHGERKVFDMLFGAETADSTT